MKDLILIGAYCPDDEREGFLSKLVDQLQEVKKDFDILICSHLVIPEYISKKVDYVFYDKNNDLIYDVVNFLGAFVLIIYGLMIKGYPFVGLNTVWALVSLKDVFIDLKKK